HAHAVHRNVEAGAGGDVDEAAFAIVPEEPRRRAIRRGVAGPARAVGDHDVLVAVAVHVEEGSAGTERFREGLLSEGAGVVHEARPRRRGDVDELEAGRGRRLRGGERHPRDGGQTGKARSHGGSTSPFLTAMSTSSAALWMPSVLMRFVRWTATVLALTFRSAAISLLDLPMAMSRSTCTSRALSFSKRSSGGALRSPGARPARGASSGLRN